MNNKHLVAIEISKKQNYIFKSNKLKENIGASLIIKYVTEDLWRVFIEDGQEIYSGGGGSFFSFQNDSKNTAKEKAEKFIKYLSLKIMKDYPEIEFFATSVGYENEIDGEKEIRKKMEKKKLERFSQFKKISFGIEEICRSSGLPASYVIEDDKTILKKRAVSTDTKAKLKAGKSSKNDKLGILNVIENDFKDIKNIKLSDINKKYNFSDFKEEQYDFPYDLDKFQRNDNSRLAVIAIDGNAMGNMVDRLKESFKKNKIEYFKKLKEFSEGIDKCYKDAFKKVVKTIIKNKKSENNLKGLEFNENYLPIRPIILAGDDVCYIAESKIALETANIFIEELEKNGKKFLENFGIKLNAKKLTACGGIAFVNKKYPFFKACELAEDLCKNAKNKLRKLKITEKSMIDWHISKGEISHDIREIRKKYENIKYKDNEDKEIFAKYNIKPLILEKENNSIYSYTTFKKMIKIINNEKRSKLKELINIFPQGKDTTDLFIKKYNLQEFFIKMNSEFLEDGQNESVFFKDKNNNETIIYYDALEIMNDFVELQVGETNEK